MSILAGELTWNMFLLSVLIITAIVYATFIHRKEQAKWHDKRPVLFYTGLGFFFLAGGTPFTQLSHVSFTLHMVNMSILYFLVPPLLLLGIPRKWFNPKTGPLLSGIFLIIFASLFLLYHLPFLIQYLLNRPTIHSLFKFGLFVAAAGMWWPIIFSVKKEETKRYAVLSGILLMPACLLFIVNGFMSGGIGANANPFLKQLSIQLCIAPEQIDHIFPYQLKYDQVIGGIAMLGLHKCSIALACNLKGRVMRGKIGKSEKDVSYKRSNSK